MNSIISQVPVVPPGAIENWLLSGAAVLSILVLARKVFARRPAEPEFASNTEFCQFRAGVEAEIAGVRDRLDARFLCLSDKLEELRADLLKDGERRAEGLHRRINELEAGLARVDERTRD